MAFDPGAFDNGGFWTGTAFVPGVTEVTTVIKVGGVDITDVVDLRKSTWQMNAGLNPGPAQIYVRDLEHEFDYSTGLETTLTINGMRVWGGYVMGVRRHYAFDVDDTENPELTPRYLILEGSDYNILFSKRFVYNKDDPTVAIPNYPANVTDKSVVLDLVANYLDLTGDGIQTNGVQHVGTPVEDMAANLFQPPESFGDGMRLIAQMPGAIFYFDPYKNLNYADVDIPNAPFELSDTPDGTTSLGYGNLELTMDGTVLGNDAMVWGAALGRNTMTFDRYENEDSIAEHGLWQWADFRSDLYRPESVHKRAETFVEGSLQNRRGHKDDAPTIRCTTRFPGLRAGMRVDFWSHVHGYHDVIPIRSMRIRFANPNEALYDLTLAHYIDDAWNTAEFPRSPGNPNDPVEVCEEPTQSESCTMFEAFDDDESDGWGTNDLNSDTYAYVSIDNAGDPGSTNGAYISSGTGKIRWNFGSPAIYLGSTLTPVGPWQSTDPWTFSMHFKTGNYTLLGNDGYADVRIRTNAREIHLGPGSNSGFGSPNGYINTDDTADVDFDWEPSTWYFVKWRYDFATGDSWLKVWRDDLDEPDWLIVDSSGGGDDDPVWFQIQCSSKSGGIPTPYYMEFDDLKFCQDGGGLTLSQPVLGGLQAYDLHGDPVLVTIEGGVLSQGLRTPDEFRVEQDYGTYFPTQTVQLQPGGGTVVGNIHNTNLVAVGPDGANDGTLNSRTLISGFVYTLDDWSSTSWEVQYDFMAANDERSYLHYNVPGNFNTTDTFSDMTEIGRVWLWNPVGSNSCIWEFATPDSSTLQISGESPSASFLDTYSNSWEFAPGVWYRAKVKLDKGVSNNLFFKVWPLLSTEPDDYLEVDAAGSNMSSFGPPVEARFLFMDVFDSSFVGVGDNPPFAQFQLIDWDYQKELANVRIYDNEAGIYLGQPAIVCYDTYDGVFDLPFPAGDVYRPAHVRQLGWGSPLDGLNCTMASGCIALDRHTEGAKTSNPPLLRSYQDDQTGGTDLGDVDQAWNTGYSEDLNVSTVSWSTFVSMVNAGRGAIVQGDYQYIPDQYSGQPDFDGPHAIYVNEFNGDATNALVYDPLRATPYWLPASILQTYATVFGGGSVFAGFTQVT